MTHFNRFTDRRIVEELLKSGRPVNNSRTPVFSNSSLNNIEHVVDCIDWNELGSGWNNTAPFPRCIVPRSNKLLITEENLESVIAQRIISASNESSQAGIEELKSNGNSCRRGLPTTRSDPLINSSRSRPTNAVLPLKEARFQPCGDLISSKDSQSLVQQSLALTLTPQQKRLQREIQRDLRKREVELEYNRTTDNNETTGSEGNAEVETVTRNQDARAPSVTPRLIMAGSGNGDSELVLPPIDIPLVSLSFNYDKLNEKMNWWNEEIRKDIQTKADARNRAKLETLIDDHGEEGTLGGDIFSIKSILHTCNYECDCNKYPERQNKLFETSVATAMLATNRETGGKFRSRFATNVALRRVSRGSAASQRRVSTRTPPTLPLSAVSSTKGGVGNLETVGDGVETVASAKASTSAGPISNGSIITTAGGVSGFCSNALGQPKVREAKSIPSIPTDCDVGNKTVTLTGKRLQVAVPR